MGKRISHTASGHTTPAYLARPSPPSPLGPSGHHAATDLAGAIDCVAQQPYPDADRAFFNDERPEVYDPAAAEDAWAKTLAFFRREMKA